VRPRGGPRLPNENVYVIASADDLPQELSPYVIYNLLYDPGSGTGLYFSPDGVTLVAVGGSGGGGSSYPPPQLIISGCF
jgi:hypothetical protein